MQEAPVRDRSAADDGGTPIVVALAVSKFYGEQGAVVDLDLEVPAKGIFGFVGPSGSGKTTTIRLLTGITKPTSGEVRVFGHPPASFSPAERARIGYLPQLPVLFPTMSLIENLNFVASIYGMPLRRSAELRAVLDLVELWDDRRKRLRDASGGMQRRLALAAALVHGPELLFLDEPTAGIDPVLRRKLWDRFHELRDDGQSLFITTQYVGEAEHCDLVGVVNHGSLIAVDTPIGLRRRAFGGDLLEVRTQQVPTEAVLAELRDLPEVLGMLPKKADERFIELVVKRADRAIPRVTECLDRHGVVAETLREEQPSFDDVFVRLMEDDAR
jgi:ABC-2 type transport system ATP-binding protein